MEQEDSNSQRRRAWEKIWDPRVLALSLFFLRQETEPRRQSGRRARRTGLLSGDNLMLGFALVGAPTSTRMELHHAGQ